MTEGEPRVFFDPEDIEPVRPGRIEKLGCAIKKFRAAGGDPISTFLQKSDVDEGDGDVPLRCLDHDDSPSVVARIVARRQRIPSSQRRYLSLARVADLLQDKRRP